MGAQALASLGTEELQWNREQSRLPYIFCDIKRSRSRVDCLELSTVNALELIPLGNIKHPVGSMYCQRERPCASITRDFAVCVDQPPQDHLSPGLFQCYRNLDFALKRIGQSHILNGSRKLILVKTLREAPNLYLHHGLTL